MRFSKNRARVVAALAIVVLVVGGGWLVFGRGDNKPATTSPKATGQTTPAATATKGADPAKLVTIETADFKYGKPAGWVEIAPQTLSLTGAASGIGRPTEPVATFNIKVLSTAPKDSTDLKNSTLEGLKKYTNFQLVSDVDTKVDGQAGQKFIYNFTDNNGQNKTTQQMSVILYKQRAFLLLFTTAAADYDKQAGDFNAILSSFKFK